MNRAFTFLLLAAATAAACFYLDGPTEAPHATHTETPQSAHAVISPRPTKPKLTNVVSESEQERIQAILTKINASVAKAAKAMTPEIRQEIIGQVMRDRDPEYRELFDAWDLDPKMAAEVLTMIRAREARLLDVGLTPSDPLAPGAPNIIKDSWAEKSYTDVQLANLLGATRHKELARLEDKMDALELSAGNKIVETLKRK